MKPSLYLETTIPSYLAAKPSNNLTNLYRQYLTKNWWDMKRNDFILFTSIYTWQECNRGNSAAAYKRLEVLKDIPQVPTSKEVEALAYEYAKLLAIPDRSIIDAFHLAICVINQIDYLLSWNCTHLGPESFKKIMTYNSNNNLFIPVLITPEAFVEVGGVDNEI